MGPVSNFDSAQVQAAEVPSSNGIGTADVLARMYAPLIGDIDGVRLLVPETLAATTAEQASGHDQVMPIPSRFNTGYTLPTGSNLMTGPNAFGHTGRDSSLGIVDPEHGITCAGTTGPDSIDQKSSAVHRRPGTGVGHVTLRSRTGHAGSVLS